MKSKSLRIRPWDDGIKTVISYGLRGLAESLMTGNWLAKHYGKRALSYNWFPIRRIQQFLAEFPKQDRAWAIEELRIGVKNWREREAREQRRAAA